jgi:hypothetical protein
MLDIGGAIAWPILPRGTMSAGGARLVTGKGG